MKKEGILNTKVGNAEKGTVFVRALHGVPNFEKYEDTKPEDWWWEKGTKKEDCAFLHTNSLIGDDYNYIDLLSDHDKNK